MPEIVTLTLNPSVDESCSVGHVVPEDKLYCSAPTYEPGGGGVNVARAVSNMGGEAMALWTRGGHTGALLTQLLHEAGLRHQPLDIAGTTRTNFVVFEETTTLQYRFGTPGAAMTGEEVERCLEMVRGMSPAPRWLVASGSLPPGVPVNFYARLAQVVSPQTRLVLDTSGEPLKHALKVGAFLVKPNLRELEQLAGTQLREDPDIDAAVRRLVESGRVQAVVVSLGAAGALLATRERVERVRSPTVPIRSKVGAGDSMVAGTVLALHRGLSLHEAVRFGVAAGAAAVMNQGAELCRREDVERLYAQL